MEKIEEKIQILGSLGHTRTKGNTNTNLATLQNTCWEVLEPGTPKQGRARNGG